MALIYFHILVVLFSLGVECRLVYRPDYKPIEDGWYKVHLPANWREARLRCHLEGAVLASPLNMDLLTQFQILFKMQQRRIYTGIHATFSKGDYYSIEGVPLDDIPVITDFGSNAECVAFTANDILADVNCTEVFPYMCFKHDTNNLFESGCGTTDIQYTLDNRTGSCYKFHARAKTWARAFMTCTAEGGHLAIINSDTESQVVKELYDKYFNKIISANNYKYVAHIGYHDWGEHGSWLTIHGQTLQEAGYDKWDANQPNNVTGGQFCGGISNNGRLNDLWCDMRLAFICEKKPSSLRIEVQQN